MIERISFPDRESWLTGRQRGIGGSDAAAVAGFSKWKTATVLWEEKCNVREAKDISGDEAVQRGVRMEDAIRAFFAATHPELTVEHHAYDILYQSEQPWLFATLDGEVKEYGWEDPPEGTKHIYIPAGGDPVEKPMPRIPFVHHGILEIKTASPNGKPGWAEWDGAVPQGYYVQILHQLLATGYSFAYLQAALYGRNGDVTLREYSFDRADCEADIQWLLQKETEFWNCVQTGKRPGVPIRF